MASTYEGRYQELFMKTMTRTALLALSSVAAALGQASTVPILHPDLEGLTEDTRIDVIIQYKKLPDQRRLKAARDRGIRHKGNLDIITSAAYNVAARDLAVLASDPDVLQIVPDRPVSASASSSGDYPPQKLRVATGQDGTNVGAYAGTGIGVAVIDSGVTKQPGFGKGGNCGVTRLVYSQNFASDAGTADLFGHGTHVASILGMNGICDSGNLNHGTAPDVNIVNLRALNSLGVGSDSTIIAAINRAIELKSTYNIRIINLSLGRGVTGAFKNDPLCQAVENAWKKGIVVVVAAGNQGRDNSYGTQGYATIATPGNDPYVITVGATRNPDSALSGHSDETMTSYSSKGPTLVDHVAKPDLVAPGNLVVARSVTSGTLPTLFPDDLRTLDDSPYLRLSGTSMATPVVAGAAALLIQKDPTLTPDQVKARLMKTAWKGLAPTASVYDSHTGGTFNIQQDLFSIGAGMLDIGSALANADKIGSTQSALSPRVIQQSGKYVLSNSYPDLSGGTSVIWGTSVTWGSSVIWGTNVSSTSVVWGNSVIWGSNVNSGYSVIWGTSVVWGTSVNPFSVGLTGFGDN